MRHPTAGLLPGATALYYYRHNIITSGDPSRGFHELGCHHYLRHHRRRHQGYQEPALPGDARADRQFCHIEAARAGAAIVHIHVRDLETGALSMATKHYREVSERIRESKADVLVNLTCGWADIYVSASKGRRIPG